MRLISTFFLAIALLLSMSSLVTAGGLDFKANMQSPDGFCSSGTGGDRTVWVLSDKPFRVALLGNSRAGNLLPCYQTGWQQTSKGYLSQVSFPSSYASQFNSLRLVREDGKGWSDWNKEYNSNEMAYLVHSNVGKSDPACVGGRSWCAVRGL